MLDPSIKFYMKVPLGNGDMTNGSIDYTAHPKLLGIADIDLRGARVLDIAANDGFWTFWAEGRGASVLAIDVDGFDGYDWGFGGPPPEVKQQFRNNQFSQWQESGRGFRALHKLFGSTAERLQLSVYDLRPDVHGQFDLIFNYGLLYHLRHPLLSLDRARAVCSGAMVLETHVVNTMSTLPISVFYFDDVFRGWTNWTGPTEAVVATWLRSAGFDIIKTRRPDQRKPNGRQIFVACAEREWADRFDGADLVELDAAYFEQVAAEVRRFVEREG